MRIFIFLLFLFSGVFTYSQDSLNVSTPSTFKPFQLISINGLGSVPLIYNLFYSNSRENEEFVEKSGKLKKRKNYFDYGINANFTHYFSARFGFGVEYVFESNTIHPFKYNPFETEDYSVCGRKFGTEDDYTSSGASLRHEAFQLLTHTLMPVIEWSTKSRVLPLSLHNQFGIGYSLSRINKKDYLYELESASNYRSSTTEFPGSHPYNSASGTIYKSIDSTFNYDAFYNYKNNYSAIKLMYATHFRFSLTEKLLMNIGVRINFNYYFGGFTGNLDTDDPEEQAFYINREEMLNYISKKRIFSIGYLNLGLAYKF